MRLVDADVLRDNLQALAYDDWNQGVTTSWADAYREFADMVEEMPTIETNRISGEWSEAERLKSQVFRCSACGGRAYYIWSGSRKERGRNVCRYKFCPNCGARMRESNEG